MSPQLLAKGWGSAKVEGRHRAAAASLAEAGVTWREAERPDHPRIAQLVRTHIHGSGADWDVDRDSGGIVAVTGVGDIIAVLVVAAFTAGGQVVAIIRQVVVDPSWRGRGVGTVALGLVPQMLERHGGRPAATIGNCAPLAARFYQRAGFTVLQPGELLDLSLVLGLPYQQPLPAGLSTRHYPCWMVRTSNPGGAI